MKNEIGPKIRDYLAEKGIKKNFVAEKIGMPQPIFSALLSGDRKMVVEEYIKICKALEVPVETFFGAK